MKKILFLMTISLFITSQSFAFVDPKVGGMITLKKGLEGKLIKGGVLYVYARQAGPDSSPGDRTPPVAVFRYVNPIFPQAFVITQKNVMIAGSPFKGPFHVVAKYSPSGDAIQRSGAIEGFDPNFPVVELGNKKLNIELNIEIP